VIIAEDLNVQGMMKNHKLAKSIGDASWAMFFNLLEYKCYWYGKEFRQIDRFVPSSKTCSRCGTKNNSLALKDRVFVCTHCGCKLDRDYNAAINIQSIGS
jgi:putative transposase